MDYREMDTRHYPICGDIQITHGNVGGYPLLFAHFGLREECVGMTFDLVMAEMIIEALQRSVKTVTELRIQKPSKYVGPS